LSGGSITTASLSETANATALKTIRASLTDTADFLLYGCNVADGSDGLAFVDALAAATGAATLNAAKSGISVAVVSEDKATGALFAGVRQ